MCALLLHIRIEIWPSTYRRMRTGSLLLTECLIPTQRYTVSYQRVFSARNLIRSHCHLDVKPLLVIVWSAAVREVTSFAFAPTLYCRVPSKSVHVHTTAVSWTRHGFDRYLYSPPTANSPNLLVVHPPLVSMSSSWTNRLLQAKDHSATQVMMRF